MATKIDRVLELSKELRTHEDAISQIRFELNSILEPDDAPIAKRVMKTTAAKVARRLPTQQGRSLPDTIVRERALFLLKKKPMSGTDLATAVGTDKKRMISMCWELVKEKKIARKPILTIIKGERGGRRLITKWALAL
jgi:hypothetical protein